MAASTGGLDLSVPDFTAGFGVTTPGSATVPGVSVPVKVVSAAQNPVGNFATHPVTLVVSSQGATTLAAPKTAPKTAAKTPQIQAVLIGAGGAIDPSHFFDKNNLVLGGVGQGVSNLGNSAVNLTDDVNTASTSLKMLGKYLPLVLVALALVFVMKK